MRNARSLDDMKALFEDSLFDGKKIPAEAVDAALFKLANFEKRFEPEPSLVQNFAPYNVRFKEQKQEKQQQQEQQQMQQQQQTGNYYIFKPYNIALNWKKFISSIPEGALTVGGATTGTWMLMLAGLVLCKKLYDLQSIQISNVHAAIMLALAARCGVKIYIEEEEIYFIVEEILIRQKNQILNKNLFHQAIDELVHFRCIEVVDGKISLLESVSDDALRSTAIFK